MLASCLEPFSLAAGGEWYNSYTELALHSQQVGTATDTMRIMWLAFFSVMCNIYN